MIDSTRGPPKKDSENPLPSRPSTAPRSRSVPRILLRGLAILSLFWLSACATNVDPRSPQAAEPATDASQAPPARPEGTAAGQQETAAGEESEPEPGGEAPATREEEKGGVEGEATEKEAGKAARIVLKTVYDDQRVGEEQGPVIEAELGLVEDERLESYLRSVAVRLLRHTTDRPFDYEFRIVDQVAPNAFALPGGKIYVSRGLLALVGSEDELAAVLGHEITHAAERHTAGRIEHSSRINPFVLGYRRAAAVAAYGRDQERDADRGGQILAAKAGYDPSGIATFMKKLDAYDRYEVGWSRIPSCLATHPTSPERSALAANRAASLEWDPATPIAAREPFGYYSMIDGLVLGENPAGGLFEDSLFVHPELRFSIRFPRGWSTENTPQAVIAISPERDAQASLTVAGEAGDLDRVIDEFIESEFEGIKIRVRDRRPIRIGDLAAVRIEGRASSGAVALWTQMTFVEHGGLVYRLAILSLAGRADVYRGRGHAFGHSFRPLDEEGARSLEVTRLRIARALENETLEQLSARTRNALELTYTGVLNDLFPSTSLHRGTPVKIGLREPYIPKQTETTEPGNDGEVPLETGSPRIEEPTRRSD
jgi:predicted Zn-dependent protease